MSSKVYGAKWEFDKEGLPNDLIARGLAKRDADGKVKLLLEDYPYADDGMLLWNAVDNWLGDYLGLYYDDKVDAKKVTNDKELQAWWNEIKTQVRSPALHNPQPCEHQLSPLAEVANSYEAGLLRAHTPRVHGCNGLQCGRWLTGFTHACGKWKSVLISLIYHP
jgi:lipoxygenase